ncbi:MAG: hypothetical protein ACRD1Z_20215 [Vicinamibacteria bacterium]
MICGDCKQEHPAPTPQENLDGSPCFDALLREREALKQQVGALKEALAGAHEFIDSCSDDPAERQTVLVMIDEALNKLKGTEKRVDVPEPRHCVKCGAEVEPGEAAHPNTCIGKGNAANPAPFHECVGVRYCSICNVRL